MRRFLQAGLFIGSFLAGVFFHGVLGAEEAISVLKAPSPSNVHYWDEMVNMFFTLGALLVLIFATTWVLKRMLKGRSQRSFGEGALRVVEKRMLSAKMAVYVLEVKGHGIVVAETQDQVEKLAEFPWIEELEVQEEPLETAKLKAPSKSFMEVLAEKLKKKSYKEP